MDVSSTAEPTDVFITCQRCGSFGIVRHCVAFENKSVWKHQKYEVPQRMKTLGTKRYLKSDFSKLVY